MGVGVVRPEAKDLPTWSKGWSCLNACCQYSTVVFRRRILIKLDKLLRENGSFPFPLQNGIVEIRTLRPMH